MIRFFIKSVVFLTLLLVAISFFGPSSKKDSDHAQTGETTTLDALLAVKDTVSDLGGFCQRNAETCETGKSFFGSLGERARDGAKIAYEYLDAKFGSNDKNQNDEIVNTGSITPDQPAANQKIHTSEETTKKTVAP